MKTRPGFCIGKFAVCSFFVSFFFFLQCGVPIAAFKCQYFNSSQPNNNVLLMECEHGNDSLCFVLWHINVSGRITVLQKGCWSPSGIEEDSVTPLCQAKVVDKENHSFCSCITERCNANFTFIGSKSGQKGTKDPTEEKKENGEISIFVVFVPVGIVSALIVALVVIYFHKRSKSVPGDTSKSKETENLLTTKELPPIQLKDVLSKGQFGMVRKGRMGNVDVAVKIFPITQRSKATPSALTEKDIYVTCNLNHQNILKFIAAQSHEEGNQTQLWLITEYLEKGSLSDFLKGNTITWDNLCHMAEGMALGLGYLHAEIPKLKPSIAHRDMKSKNVLVKNNLTCCISDFGLSLKFDSKDGPGDTHGQVGTRRYMAPEVLEGAINFSREAFLRIDMYASGLCLWELLSRCTALEGPVNEYKFPFEEEVGMHPSLDELQDYVVQRKVRPKIREEWKNHVGMEGVIVTIEECWDHDADARLTADCVAERVKQLRATVNAKRQTSAPLSVSLNINSDPESGLLA